MNKKSDKPQIWKWVEDSVDTREEHIKVGHGGFEETFVPMALVAPGEENCFVVQILAKRDEIEPEKQEIYDSMIKEINYFLVELHERDPWLYAKYHCGTASNMYSNIRWAFYPKGYEGK